jgi:Domain of unknown function (DUF397)
MSDGTPMVGSGGGCDLGGGWWKSSYSMSNGHCVATARLADGRIGVRDTKAGSTGAVLRFDPAIWAAFLQELRDPESSLGS